jgi:hypothetical protein
MEYLDKIYGTDEEEEEHAAAAVVSAVVSHESSQIECQHASSAWRGRLKCSRPNIQRGLSSWEQDYLSCNPTYPPSMFRRAFRIPLKLYFLMRKELIGAEPRLLQLKDGLGRLGHTTDQKLLVCFRRLANGTSYTQLDDQARMSVESPRQVTNLFLNSV